MATRPLRVLSLCSGVGMLDLGLQLAGIGARPICYVEIEATATQVLASRIADGFLHDAPIWSDIKTFRGGPWRGVVDLLLAGYPCTPFSQAGKQLGEADPRHLWPEVARLIREIQPEFVFLENVDAHFKIGFEQVRAELRRLGYDVEVGGFSAEEVGANHIRKRLFALAFREGRRCGELRQSSWIDGFAHRSGTRLADARDGLVPVPRRQTEARAGTGPAGAHPVMGDTAGSRRHARQPISSGTLRRGCRRTESGRRGTAVVPLADSPGGQRQQPRRSRSDAGNVSQRERRLPGSHRCGSAVADSPGFRYTERRGVEYHLEQEFEAVARVGVPVFAPGPDDIDAWRDILSRHPELEPAIRGDADGSTNRVNALRSLGNGCVPVVAALAILTLAYRAGIVLRVGGEA